MREALDLAMSDRLAEAQAAFERLLVDSVALDDDSLPEVCGAFAGVQHKLGRMDEALSLHERALREAQRLDAGLFTVSVYRYFLGNFLVGIGRAADAVDTLQPSVGQDDKSDRFLLLPLAKALWILQRHDEARATARRALELAKTDEHRQKAVESLGEILDGTA
jgi:tetratricopeptide (TPR) repeat protein